MSSNYIEIIKIFSINDFVEEYPGLDLLLFYLSTTYESFSLLHLPLPMDSPQRMSAIHF